MLGRIVAAGVLVFLLMLAVKDGRVLRLTGLTASCTVVRTAVDGSQLDGCRPGLLEGFPDLTRQSCTGAGVSGQMQYWRCPAPLVGDQATR